MTSLDNNETSKIINRIILFKKKKRKVEQNCDIDYCDIYRLSNYRRRRFQSNFANVISVM